MTALIYIAGFLIGAAVFLYFLSIFQSGAEKLAKMRKETAAPDPEATPEKVDTGGFRRNPGRAPGVRMCPLCNSELTKYEALYASKFKAAGEIKILIYGCRYCYKPEKDSDAPRKSDL